MKPDQIARRLLEQQWCCAYVHDTKEGSAITPGSPVALAYDGYGLIHLECARVGHAPTVRPALPPDD